MHEVNSMNRRLVNRTQLDIPKANIIISSFDVLIENSVI